jgi:hypothetical protein
MLLAREARRPSAAAASLYLLGNFRIMKKSASPAPPFASLTSLSACARNRSARPSGSRARRAHAATRTREESRYKLLSSRALTMYARTHAEHSYPLNASVAVHYAEKTLNSMRTDGRGARRKMENGKRFRTRALFTCFIESRKIS